VYAIPLVVVEISAIFINFSDRYIIQFYLGLEPLGIYSASNNIVRYVSQIILIPINLALLPICMKIWVKEGEEKTREFLSKALRYFSLLAFPITLGFIAIGKDVIVLLASEKYVESHIIIPYVMIGKILLAACNIFNVAWFINKKTSIYALLTFISFLCNIILNIILIKAFGMIGAAYSTLITYIILFISISVISFRYLSFKIDFTHLGLYFASSILMYFFIKNIGSLDYLALDIIVKISLGMLFYCALIVICDNTIKNYLMKYLHAVHAKAFKKFNV
jgi:O-antigen/teichoic acid export membrane protein